MGKPAFTRLPGRQQSPPRYVAQAWDTRTSTYDLSDRFLGKGPLRAIPGTSTIWRYPSGYRQSVGNTRCEAIDIIVNSNGGGGSVRGGCPFTFATDAFISTHMLGSFDGIYATPDNSHVARAETECMQKIGAMKVDLGTNIGTAKQTLNQFLRPSIALWQAYIAARRGQWHRLPYLLGMRRRDVLTGKLLAHRWLEYQYGWRPLLDDIYNGYKAYQNAWDKDAMLIHASKTIKSSLEGKGEVNTGRGIAYASSWKIDRKVHIRIDAQVTDQLMRGSAQVGLVNPLSVAWELMPWSFLLDWCMPVGNVLESISARAGLSFVSGSKTITHEGSQDFSASYVYPPASNQGWSVTQGGRYVVEKFDCSRSIYGGFPIPTLYAKNPFSSEHVANAAALWRSTLKLR